MELISGEWFFVVLDRANGGSIILLRALFVAIWIFFLLLPAGLALHDVIDPSRQGTQFDWPRLFHFWDQHASWLAVVFGSVYTALYARFAAQWRYLADLYNKVKEASIKYAGEPNSDERIAEWKAGFVEDAQELHLAKKRIFAQVIKHWLADEAVKNAFVGYSGGPKDRYQKLVEDINRAIGED
ncbi:hypothetical protein [Caballeronia sp. SBC1]|uniref:hypothetical protein n=1 Tax=Caballeronia sp. SBC1 TaxID=2705548 RepID=UPI00140CB427|nr:hypothetical protein [Caballeronia sp. SBC1]